MNEDTNTIIKTFLDAQSSLTTLVSDRIYSPRLPENVTLPAIGFFTRGGSANPYMPGIVSPSVQFDCWGSSPHAARQVYRTLFSVLQGIQNRTVTISGTDHLILSAIEEVQGQDLQDVDIPEFYRVLTFFSIMIRAEQ